MARGAFTLIRTLRELSAVRVVSVAIRAIGKRQRFVKISSSMALQTIHLRVHSKQRILCFRVIELSFCRNRLPAACRMARLARLPAERTLMRIGVAIAALGESNA